MKKNWEKPKLTNFGTIESVTKMQIEDAVNIGQAIFPENGFGLFSSLSIGG